jgi:tRNA nucleotidyltransferase (CCA-adding enzyme)
MSFKEYGLFIETGPGQAYEQEVKFIERTLALEDSLGQKMVRDSRVRETIQEVNDFSASALGRSAFSNGVRVPTCADP